MVESVLVMLSPAFCDFGWCVADNLHPRILYEIRHEICYPLTEIFETSWKMSNIPLDWQRANIVAVYKKIIKWT